MLPLSGSDSKVGWPVYTVYFLPYLLHCPCPGYRLLGDSESQNNRWLTHGRAYRDSSGNQSAHLISTLAEIIAKLSLWLSCEKATRASARRLSPLEFYKVNAGDQYLQSWFSWWSSWQETIVWPLFKNSAEMAPICYPWRGEGIWRGILIGYFATTVSHCSAPCVLFSSTLLVTEVSCARCLEENTVHLFWFVLGRMLGRVCSFSQLSQT